LLPAYSKGQISNKANRPQNTQQLDGGLKVIFFFFPLQKNNTKTQNTTLQLYCSKNNNHHSVGASSPSILFVRKTQ
jgi:hypothetical protein